MSPITILDKLKSIFEGNFSDILSNNNINFYLFSQNPKETLELKDEKILSIDVNKAKPKEKELLKKEILDDTIQRDKKLFLTDHSLQKTKQIKSNLPKEQDEKLLKFYKDKLKPDLFKALEASLVVRSAFQNGQEIQELKRDITREFPQFGNNLCNLVSQGYFDDHFKSLFYSMIEDEEFDIIAYQNKVEKIVKSLPYMVFLARHKSYDEQSGEVKFKLERLRRYGTGRLLLHGIGNENVRTAIKILNEYRNDENIIIEREINQQQTIITATFNF